MTTEPTDAELQAAQADSVQEDAQVGCFGPTPYRPKQPN